MLRSCLKIKSERERKIKSVSEFLRNCKTFSLCCSLLLPKTRRKMFHKLSLSTHADRAQGNRLICFAVMSVVSCNSIVGYLARRLLPFDCSGVCTQRCLNIFIDRLALNHSSKLFITSCKSSCIIFMDFMNKQTGHWSGYIEALLCPLLT